MIGAIIGDVVGSRFEFKRDEQRKTTDFEFVTDECTFTDDTILTCAIAESILHDIDPVICVKKWVKRHPYGGYGGMFKQWMINDGYKPYNSFGNGSAMRTSPVGWLYDDFDTVMEKAKLYSSITHNHPEGIKGAQAISVAIFMARNNSSKLEIEKFISSEFGYDVSTPLDIIRPTYSFDETCQGSVPQSIRAFLESTDFENCIRLAVSIGGDSDTIACIAGSIAEAYYKHIPNEIEDMIKKKLAPEMIVLLDEFYSKISWNNVL